MHSIEQLHAYVEKGLKQKILTREPVELYDPIQYALSAGGKRLLYSTYLLARAMLIAKICSEHSIWA